MEELNTTIVPLGSLAFLFAGVSILVLIRRTNLSREAENAGRESFIKQARNHPSKHDKYLVGIPVYDSKGFRRHLFASNEIMAKRNSLFCSSI